MFTSLCIYVWVEDAVFRGLDDEPGLDVVRRERPLQSVEDGDDLVALVFDRLELEAQR